MRGGDVVHQRHVRPDDAGEVGDVAGLAGAHLVDGEVTVVGRIDHRQRQADLVVAIAWIGVTAAGQRQDRLQQRLDPGLAVAAGHRQYLGGAVVLQAARDLGKRQQAIGHHQLRQVDLDRMLDHQRASAAHGRVVGELVAVEALAAQGHVQSARHQAAGVVAHAVHDHVVTAQLAAGPVGEQGQGQPLHGRTCSAVTAATVSALAP